MNKTIKLWLTITSLFSIFLMFTALNTSKTIGFQTEWKAPASADKLKNPLSGNEDDLKEGKKLYKQLCAICHGDKGKGDGMAGVSLKPRPANLTSEKVQSQSDGAIFWKMTEGRAPMAAYKDLIKEDQRWQLVSFIRTLKK